MANRDQAGVGTKIVFELELSLPPPTQNLFSSENFIFFQKTNWLTPPHG
jgi:hypothetical protein